MSGVLIGTDGLIFMQLADLGQVVANSFRWTVTLGNEFLEKTDLSNEARRKTGGLKNHTGSFTIMVNFLENNQEALSVWQLLNFAVSNTDDDMQAQIELIIQKGGLPLQHSTCDASPITDQISLVGTVVVGDISINCEDPANPLVATLAWEADGLLTPTRS